MTDSRTPTPFEATPDEALAALGDHDGPVVVDLDETLLLANSTMLFLATVRPAQLVYWLTKVIDLVRPWRRSAGRGDRDSWHIRMVLSLLPWSRRAWNRAVATTVDQYLNQRLISALRKVDAPIVVSTKGFTPIVEPIVERAGLSNARLVSIDPLSGEDRDDAKLRMTKEVLSQDGLAQSLVVTDDGLADHRLLEQCRRPLRVIWPMAPFPRPFSTTYVPGRYLSVKRPNAHYGREILKEDLAFWVLASIFLAENALAHGLGLVVLAVSFWAVYEFGYMDNDRSAERFEQNPMLSDAYHERRMEIAPWKPLSFAALSGVAGLWVFRFSDAPLASDYLRWAGLLVATALTFCLYNRVDKQTRILIYPLLQILRFGAFLVVAQTTPVAELALAVIVLIRWAFYFVYRTREGGWPNEDLSVVRLVVFGALALLLAVQHDWSDLVAPTTIALALWMVVRARNELPAAIRAAYRIDRGPSQS